MYLVSGRKQWTFYPAESAGGLGPVFVDSMDPVFRPGQLNSLPSYTLGMSPSTHVLISKVLKFYRVPVPHCINTILVLK